MEHVVAKQPHAWFQRHAVDEGRWCREHALEARRRFAHCHVFLPLDAAGARGVAHVQRAIVRVHGEYRPRLGGAYDSGVVGARGDGHRVRLHERGHEGRIGVTHLQVGDLVIEQSVLAAGRRISYAVQDHGPDASVRRVVVAVGVPADRAVRIRDVIAADGLAGDRHAADAVVVGEPVVIEAGDAELAGRAGAAGPCRSWCRDWHRSPCSRGRSGRRVPAVPRGSMRAGRALRRRGRTGLPDNARASRRATPGRRAHCAGRTDRPGDRHGRAAWRPASLHSPVARAPRSRRRGASSRRPAMPRCRLAAASGASTSITCEIAHVRS